MQILKKRYRLHSLESSKIIVYRDVKFYENVFPFKMSIDKDKSITNDVNTLRFFYCTFGSTNDFVPSSPNDENKDHLHYEDFR